MKNTYKIIVLIFFLTAGSVITYAEQITTNRSDVESKQYFSDLSLDGLAYIKKYSRIPQDRTRADPEKCGHILIKFWAWMKRTLSEAVLPPQSLLSTNIILISENDALEEDIAYLPYSISNKSFLVVQNADTIMLFTDCQASLPSKNVILKEDILSITTNLLCTNIVNKLTAINVKKFDSYYIAGTVSTNESLENWIKHVVPVKIVTDGKQICISLEKDRLGYAMPAWAPLLYQWFKGPSYRKWEKKGISHSVTNGITNSLTK